MPFKYVNVAMTEEMHDLVLAESRRTHQSMAAAVRAAMCSVPPYKKLLDSMTRSPPLPGVVDPVTLELPRPRRGKPRYNISMPRA